MSLLHSKLQELPRWLSIVVPILAGALVPFSFAPFNLWPLGVLALVVLALLIHQQPLKTVWWRCWLFGVGMYAFGTSWIYVSISGFGGAPAPLAALLVLIFSLCMSACFSLPFYAFGRWFSQHKLNLLVAFPATWLISEWVRTWLLTGFPWLFIGYADLNNWLSGWAPLLGVMGLSLFTAFTAGTIAQALIQPQKKLRAIIGGALVVAIWMAGYFLQNIEWTKAATTPTSVAIVQPNINQQDKWQVAFRNTNMELLKEKTQPLWGHKIIIWPEAAITDIYSEAIPFLNEINRTAADNHSGLLTGIIFDDNDKTDPSKYVYYNTIATFGDAIGFHHKRRLVPFGEYVPIEALRNLIEFFNLPTSYISLGPEEQHGLMADNLKIAPAVCYEVAFPDLIAGTTIDAQLIVSVSNLGWFGDSLGRHQFMQMAQMRALETQHYHAYSTNNGPSAIFDRKGQVIAQTKAFEQTTLSSEVFAVDGSTPFMKYRSWPVVIFSLLCLMGLFVAERFFKRVSNGQSEASAL